MTIKEQELKNRLDTFDEKYEWNEIQHRYYYKGTNIKVPELEAKL